MATDTYATRRHRRRAGTTHVKAIHVIIYTRVSTPAQNTLSEQQERCEAFAEERGWTVVDRFAETASAFGPFEQNRPVLRRALARALEEAAQFDTVVLVDDITRLSRHVPDADRLIASGIPFCVRGRPKPLGKGMLRKGISAASKPAGTSRMRQCPNASLLTVRVMTWRKWRACALRVTVPNFVEHRPRPKRS